jgi:hypothetical protein
MGELVIIIREGLNEPVVAKPQTVGQRLQRFYGAMAHVGRRGGTRKSGLPKSLSMTVASAWARVTPRGARSGSAAVLGL